MKTNGDYYKKLFRSRQVQKYGQIMCELAKECWELKLSDTTGFSISQVIPNTNIVLADRSGTGFRRNKVSIKDLLLLDLDGNLLYQQNSNLKMAPVNIVIHLEGYRNSSAKGCIHWHDPFTNAFACYGKTIHPLTLQSKLIGDTPCILVDDRKQKNLRLKTGIKSPVPSGLHVRPDVYFVMKQVGERAGKILSERNEEFKRHGIVMTHYEHGLFAFGRDIEEAFENGYRTYRNAQTIIFSNSIKNYPDKKALKNSGPGDLDNSF